MRKAGAFALAIVAALAGALAPGASAWAEEEEPWRIRAKSSYTVRDGNDDRIFAFEEDVVILHGDLVATSARAEYLDRLKRAILSGGVVMEQDSTIVRAPMALYDRETRIARFPQGVVIERPTGTAIADEGWWWRDDNRFELRGRAAAADTAGTVEGDALTYDATGEVFWAKGSARMTDDVSGVVVDADQLHYERAAELAIATGDPSAIFTDEDEVPIRVTADRLEYDPVRNIALAKENVVVLRETMEATAGLVRFDRDVNRAIFREDPVIVDGPTEIRGDRIELRVEGGGTRRLNVRGNAQVSNRFLSDRDRPAAPDDGLEDGPAPPDDEPDADGPAPPDDEPDADGPEPAPDEGLESALQEAALEAAVDAVADARAELEERADEILEDVQEFEVPEEIAEPPVETARAEVEAALEALAKQRDARAESTAAPAEAEAADGDLLPDLLPEAPDVADAAADSAATDSTAADDLPEWLRIPGDRLPRQNLLFGDEITILFRDDALEVVEVVGHGRSKFYPNEESGEFTEWNDVVGDTIQVWFSESSVDSVTVFGHGVGEYRMPAGEDAFATPERLKEVGKLVEYEAPVIRYHRDTEKMHLEGGSTVQYKSMVLTSGTIDFDAPKEVMVAGGDPPPVLVDTGDEIYGEQMRYDLESERGEILHGRTRFEDAFYEGDDIWKIGDDVLAVESASYTTCELDHAHYHFSSKQMKIYLDDKVVAKPVVLKIRNIPVFALPFYMASLKKGRHSGFLLPNLELGVDDNRGRFIRNVGYYWAPNDYSDAQLALDFYPSQDRIVTNLNARYKLRYRFEGSAAVRYNRDVPRNRKDTAVELTHRQQFSETLTLTGDARFLSSEDIYRDIDDDQRLNRDIRSHLTLTKKFEGSNRSLRAELERRENLDTGAVEETLPSIFFSQPRRPILGGDRRSNPDQEPGFLSGVYYSLDSRFVHDRSKQPTGDDDGTFLRENRAGAQSNTSLSTTQEFGPYLRISPSANGEATWVDRDERGDANALRATYRTSVSARTTVYGTFLRPIGPIRGFRHVFEPDLSWSWAPEFREYFFVEEGDTTGTLQDRFAAFGGISSTPRESSRMNFSTRNLLRTKLARGETERSYDVFTLRNSISYDLLAEDRGAKPLSDLTSSLNVLSGLPVNQSWTVRHDPYTWEVQSTSVRTALNLRSSMFRSARPEPAAADSAAAGADGGNDIGNVYGEGGRRSGGGGLSPAGDWDLGVSHTVNSSGGSLSSSVVFNSYWTPTPKWTVRFETQYDLKTGENTSQHLSVGRLLHCWQLSFDRSLLGGEWQYYLKVNVIDLPDIQAERGDRSRSRSSFSGGSTLGGGLF